MTANGNVSKPTLDELADAVATLDTDRGFSRSSKGIGPLEIEILSALSNGCANRGSAREVHRHIVQSGHHLDLEVVDSVLRCLLKMGVLVTESDGNTYIFRAVLEHKSRPRRMVESIVARLIDFAADPFIQCLIRPDEICGLLDERTKTDAAHHRSAEV